MTHRPLARGEVVTIADRGGDFTGKPRPAVVVQSGFFSGLDSVTICPLTTAPVSIPSVTRIQIEPSDGLALRSASWIAVEKITTIRQDRVGRAMGRLSHEDVQRLNGTLALSLGPAA